MVTAILWHGVYPWDRRIEKFVTLLERQGHAVHLICRGKPGMPGREQLASGNIHRIGAPPIFGARLTSWLSYPLFFSPLWIYGVMGILRRHRADLLIVRDLPLAFLAACLGKILGIPVIIDMAENYPAALIAYQKSSYQPFLFMNGALPRAYERLSLRLLDHVIVVAEEQQSRLVQMGVPEQNISCVRNTPELQRYSPHRTNGENGGIGTTRGETLLYVGKVDRHRGVETAIRAMPRIVERFPRATLRIIGSGTEQRRLADITRELGMEAFVIFEGWLDFEHVPTRIGESTICLIPHLQSEHTDTTVPNKIFDYMAAGKPVVASDCAPLKRIVRETRCGLTFKSGSSDDLSEKILQLLENAGARAYGLRGQRAVLEKYHWEKDCAVLLDAINHACSHGKQRRVEG